MDQENVSRSQSHVSRSTNKVQHNATIHSLPETEATLKRKREDEPKSDTDPKLQEYLGLMQPASKSRTWANEDTGQAEPHKQDALGDVSTQTVPVSHEKEKHDYHGATTKKKKAGRDVDQASPLAIDAPTASATPVVVQDDLFTGTIPPAPGAERAATTDDDWLRSRTSRLLGLVDDDDVRRRDDDGDAGEMRKGGASGTSEEGSGPRPVDVRAQVEADGVQPHGSVANPGSNAVESPTSATNRLFIRNLPYTTTEDDLRHHFERLEYGRIEEVGTLFRQTVFQNFEICQICDEHPIGTSYATHMMSVGYSILVDTLYF